MQSNLMHMYSGLDVNVFDLQSAEINVKDIAHHLANQCRFVGACHHHYSVAQHSVYVAAVVWFRTRNSALTQIALLHDASEAYLGDIPRPLKCTKMFEFYRDVEAQVQTRIFKALEIQVIPEALETINRVDNEMLALECRDLFDPAFIPKSTEIPPAEAVDWSVTITEWDWYIAKRRFTQAYYNPETLDSIHHHFQFKEKTT